MNLSKYKKRAKCNICGKVRYIDKLVKFNGHSYCKVTNSIAAIPNTIYIPLYVDGKKQSSIGITKCQKELIKLLYIPSSGLFLFIGTYNSPSITTLSNKIKETFFSLLVIIKSLRDFEIIDFFIVSE